MSQYRRSRLTPLGPELFGRQNQRQLLTLFICQLKVKYFNNTRAFTFTPRDNNLLVSVTTQRSPPSTATRARVTPELPYEKESHIEQIWTVIN